MRDRHSAARHVLRLVVGTALVGAVLSPLAPAAGAPVPTVTPPARATGQPTLTAMAVPTVEQTASRQSARVGNVVAQLGETSMRTYNMVAVTWDHGSVPAQSMDSEKFLVQVRNRVDGAWTAWQTLPSESDEGPSDVEDSDLRDGTAPLWVGAADGVAVRATATDGSQPEGLKVVTIDAQLTTDGPELTSVTSQSPASGAAIKGAPKFPATPRIITREQWGADERLGDQCFDPVYAKMAKMVFVHHTAGSNDYTASESPAIVRSILAYHTQAKGWCDIGYNFLVDKFGNIFEGRAGGIRIPIRGAHAGDYNENTVGMSLMGNFEEARPTAPMKNALVRLIGWRLGTSYVPARGWVRVNGTRFHRISGHRDAMSTSCPGRYVYNQLPRIRERVGDYLGSFSSKIDAASQELTRAVTGAPFIGEVRYKGGRRTTFGNGTMFARRGSGTHWVSGKASFRFQKLHGVTGPLGWPTTDAHSTRVARVRVQGFQDGIIVLIPRTYAKALYGPILTAYRQEGNVAGALGLPETSVLTVRAGQRVNFEHGVIRYNATDGTTAVEYQ